MFRFIFVCYNHGAGGEKLSVQISKNAKCNTLKYDVMDKRTWSYDYFNKLFLKPYDKNWKDKCDTTAKSELIHVVPSHYSPSTLREVFPNEFYVVINYPKTAGGVCTLKGSTYEKVWCTKHNNLHQKLGYWRVNTNREITRDIMKQLNQELTNGEIQCLINDMSISENNIRTLFNQNFYDVPEKLNYTDAENIITIEYEALQTRHELLEKVNERI